MANQVEKFYLQPTAYSPNSPLPVLLYRAELPQPHSEDSTTNFLQRHDWEKKGTWGHIGIHHYHPNAHECYGIFQGSSTLCIGRGKLDNSGGVYIPVNQGDVIVIPAGTTHCSLESKDDYRYIGVYPKGQPKWRNEHGKDPVDRDAVWRETSGVGMPVQDPVYGSEGPLVQLWKQASQGFS